MNKREKQQILIFAREAFHKFYDENFEFLSERKYKPGKKTYRNLLSINKMMSLYLDFGKDYVVKADVISLAGWGGPSSYVQHERIITNFDLSDTSWEDRDRAVLLLNDRGIKLRNKYERYVLDNPGVVLKDLMVLPDFAKKYLIQEIAETTSVNMTLWKNTIISALYLYCELGYMPYFPNSSSVPSEKEKRALIKCCNYTKGHNLMDVTYIQQPIAMLKNLGLLDDDRHLTNSGYNLLKNMKMFAEVEASVEDYENSITDVNIEEIEDILDAKVTLEKVDAPEIKVVKVKEKKTTYTGPRNRNFDKLDKENKLTGDLGEKLVLDYEREKLISQGVSDVEDKVYLTSSKREKYGNAYPCDIISFDPVSGEEIFIEVKTTKGGIDEPFYISSEEVKFSEDNATKYRLYRVFSALSTGKPKFFETMGNVRDNFNLKEKSYVASRIKEDI